MTWYSSGLNDIVRERRNCFRQTTFSFVTETDVITSNLSFIWFGENPRFFSFSIFPESNISLYSWSVMIAEWSVDRLRLNDPASSAELQTQSNKEDGSKCIEINYLMWTEQYARKRRNNSWFHLITSILLLYSGIEKKNDWVVLRY